MIIFTDIRFEKYRREDLGMTGNQLNYTITTWTVGYLLGEIPSNLLLTRIRPSIWLPILQVSVLFLGNVLSNADFAQIIWSVLTMLLARINNVNQLYALRFFIGKSHLLKRNTEN